MNYDRESDVHSWVIHCMIVRLSSNAALFGLNVVFSLCVIDSSPLVIDDLLKLILRNSPTSEKLNF